MSPAPAGGVERKLDVVKGNRRMNRVRTVFPLKSHSKNPLTATVSADYKSFDSLLWCLMCLNTTASDSALLCSSVCYSDKT